MKTKLLAFLLLSSCNMQPNSEVVSERLKRYKIVSTTDDGYQTVELSDTFRDTKNNFDCRFTPVSGSFLCLPEHEVAQDEYFLDDLCTKKAYTVKKPDCENKNRTLKYLIAYKKHSSVCKPFDPKIYINPRLIKQPTVYKLDNTCHKEFPENVRNEEGLFDFYEVEEEVNINTFVSMHVDRTF